MLYGVWSVRGCYYILGLQDFTVWMHSPNLCWSGVGWSNYYMPIMLEFNDDCAGRPQDGSPYKQSPSLWGNYKTWHALRLKCQDWFAKLWQERSKEDWRVKMPFWREKVGGSFISSCQGWEGRTEPFQIQGIVGLMEKLDMHTVNFIVFKKCFYST